MENNNSGFLVVDKPAGMSSAAVVAIVKRLIKAKKVGHTGTLDPFATGVLVCCINKATRLAGFLLKSHKTYEALLCLGVATDTQDATGTVTDRANGDVVFSEKTLTDAFSRYKGKSKQQPPVYSALKLNGVPSYKLARAGKAVQKPPRQIEITDLRITQINLPYVRFEVSCSAGTYIRTLCADIGNDLGCGGHLKELRRTASGGFTLDRAIVLNDLETLAKSGYGSSAMISMTTGLNGMPACRVPAETVNKIKNGVTLTQKDIEPQKKEMHGYFKAIDGNDNLVAVLNHEKASPNFSYCCVLI